MATSSSESNRRSWHCGKRFGKPSPGIPNASPGSIRLTRWSRTVRKIRFSGAWSVCLRGGGTHTNHVHPQGWLSSALYIALPPTIGPDEQQGWLKLGEPDAALGLDLPPRRLVEPRPGRLALFPSWMWHGTRPFAQGERLTVAFDVAGAGYGAPHRLSKN